MRTPPLLHAQICDPCLPLHPPPPRCTLPPCQWSYRRPLDADEAQALSDRAQQLHAYKLSQKLGSVEGYGADRDADTAVAGSTELRVAAELRRKYTVRVNTFRRNDLLKQVRAFLKLARARRTKAFFFFSSTRCCETMLVSNARGLLFSLRTMLLLLLMLVLLLTKVLLLPL